MMLARRLVLVAVALLASWLVAGGPVRAEDARELVQKALDSIPKAPLSARVKMTSDRGWDREATIYRAQQDDMEKIYLEVTAPTDMKDTRFLLFDRLHGKDEQWMYVPAMKRSIQLNAQTRKQDFLGSDFAVVDLVRPDVDAYTYTFVGEETVDGRKCKIVESVPKEQGGEEPYSKRTATVDPADMIVLRTQMYDADGKLAKVWTIEKYEKKDGFWTPLVQRMENKLTNHWSKFELLDVQYNAEVPSDAFNKSYLIR